jgi:hypothetical protein
MAEQPGMNIPRKKLNVWMIISAVLLVALLAAIIIKPTSISGKAVADSDVGKKTIDFINTYLVPDGNITLSSVSDLGSLYQVNTTYQGRIVPIYVTKDGKYFIQQISDMTNPPKVQADATAAAAATPANVTKSEKPKAEAFVFAYCPYGLQFEKALIPVYNLLKDKADINIVFIGAMHGEYEKVESLRQLCILKEYDKDKLFEYLNKFNADTKIGTCGKDANCSLPLVETLMDSISIDKDKIESCMSSDAESLYSTDNARAKEFGISGSPTFVINGAKVQVSRSAEDIKKAICNAFTEAPDECSQALSSAAATPGFGSGTAAASSGGGCGA